jgi:hypothetical protein
MKLMAKCRYCERDLLLSLLVEPHYRGQVPLVWRVAGAPPLHNAVASIDR